MDKNDEVRDADQELVPVEGDASAGAMAPVGYFEGDNWNLPEGDDVLKSRLPLLKICYQGSNDKPEGAVPGMFYNTLTGECFISTRVLLLDIGLRKSMWAQYDPSNKKPEPICCSDDGYVPSGRGTDPQPGPCRSWTTTHGQRKLLAFCPHARWQTDAKSGKDAPPACPDNYICLLWLLDYGFPVLFTTKRKGERALSDAKNALELSGHVLRDKEHPEIPPRILTPFLMGVRNEGTYWTPTFQMQRGTADRTPIDDAIKIHAMFGALRARASMTTIEDASGTEPVTEEVDTSESGTVPF